MKIYSMILLILLMACGSPSGEDKKDPGTVPGPAAPQKDEPIIEFPDMNFPGEITSEEGIKLKNASILGNWESMCMPFSERSGTMFKGLKFKALIDEKYITISTDFFADLNCSQKVESFDDDEKASYIITDDILELKILEVSADSEHKVGDRLYTPFALKADKLYFGSEFSKTKDEAKADKLDFEASLSRK